MSAVALALGLFSAITLAAANVSVKLGTDILLGRAVLSTSAALIVLPLAFFVPLPDRATWLALLVAVPVHYGYQMCLVQAMSRGNLNLVFPIMRGVAPLLTAVSVMVFLGQRLALLEWLGLGIATAAVVAFAWPPSGRGLRKHPDASAIGWAAATAVFVSLYNATDTYGVHVAPRPETFIVWLFLVDPICVTTTAILSRRRNLWATLREMRLGYGVSAGLLAVLSFGSSLFAFSLAETAKVSALRETSVVWAALLGRRLLDEDAVMRRGLAALVLAVGLVVMQFG